MPRQQRYRIPDIPQHVIARGNDRKACFFDPSDYRIYLELLREASARHRCEIHAYVLMTNHVHLLVTPRVSDGISRMMQAVGRRYVQQMNALYGRTGTLWEGRYKASVVQHERYFLLCQRYIELNPVRAQMVTKPSDYRWSSYRSNADGEASPMLSPHQVYLALGADGGSRCRAYRALFAQHFDSSELKTIRTALHHNHVLGDDRFREEIGWMMARRLGRAGPGRPRKRGEEQAADGRQLDYLES